MSALTFWLIFTALFGACAGSFINVVIYRLPRGLSPLRPGRSFCPACRSRIRWYDNIPVLSWLLLAGRCRHCRAAISLHYPIVELLAAVAAVVLFDAFFVARLRAGIGELAADWPMWLAHAVLMWGLLAAATIDVEHYSIDLRITWLIVLVGVVAHTVWTPAASDAYPRPGGPLAVASLAAVAGLLLVAFVQSRLQQPVEAPLLPEHAPQQRQATGLGHRALVLLAAAALIALVAMPTMAASLHAPGQGFALRAFLSGVLAFAVIVVAGLTPRPADRQIIDAIERERPLARRQALRELVELLPALVLGVLVLVVHAGSPRVADAWSAAMNWQAAGSWRPLAGLTTSVCGFVVAGAIGWAVRILFTLLLGREAFGTGDIHLMAAAGAVAGWPVVLIGFFLASPLALLGVVLLLARKTSRAIPFGPWLSLGLWLALLYHDLIVNWAMPFLSSGLEGLGLLIKESLL